MSEGRPDELPTEANPNTLTGTLYAVTAVRDGVQLPTFFLDANVQGIVGTGHAYRIARRILGSDPTIGVSKL